MSARPQAESRITKTYECLKEHGPVRVKDLSALLYQNGVKTKDGRPLPQPFLRRILQILKKRYPNVKHSKYYKNRTWRVTKKR